MVLRLVGDHIYVGLERAVMVITERLCAPIDPLCTVGMERCFTYMYAICLLDSFPIFLLSKSLRSCACGWWLVGVESLEKLFQLVGFFSFVGRLRSEVEELFFC
jgi:hypothetical protein